MTRAAATTAATTITRTCSCCGNTFEVAASRKGGRPAEYCSADCRQLSHLLGKVEGLLDRVDMTPERASQLRSRLWGAANVLNYKGKPQGARSSERQRARRAGKAVPRRANG